MGSRGVAIEPRAAGHRKTAETADREAPHRLPRATGRADQTQHVVSCISEVNG